MNLENGNTKSHLRTNDATTCYQRHKADQLLLDTVIVCMIYLMTSLVLKRNYSSSKWLQFSINDPYYCEYLLDVNRNSMSADASCVCVISFTQDRIVLFL